VRDDALLPTGRPLKSLLAILDIHTTDILGAFAPGRTVPPLVFQSVLQAVRDLRLTVFLLPTS